MYNNHFDSNLLSVENIFFLNKNEPIDESYFNVIILGRCQHLSSCFWPLVYVSQLW